MNKVTPIAGLCGGLLGYVTAFATLFVSGLWILIGHPQSAWLLAIGMIALAGSMLLIRVSARQLGADHVAARLLAPTTTRVGLLLALVLGLFLALAIWLHSIFGGGFPLT